MQMPWKAVYVHASSRLQKQARTQMYLTPLDPMPLYIGPLQAKRYLFFRGTGTDSYSYLSVLYILCLAACGAVGHLFVLCSVRQLSTRTMQCWAASSVYCLAFHIEYIIFVPF